MVVYNFLDKYTCDCNYVASQKVIVCHNCDQACENQHVSAKGVSKSLSLLQKLIVNLRKWDTTFRAQDITENITRCNLHSHG